MHNKLNGSTADLLEAAHQSILFTAKRPELVMDRGEGMYLWDTDGKAYLDFSGGWAVTSLGHSPKVLQAAIAKQAGQLVHASPGFYNKPMIEFSKLMTDISGFDKIFFASSGSEANESAIKLARKHGAKNLSGAYEIITLTNSFHGRTLAMMSATGKAQWESLYAPKVPGFKHVPINDFDACFAAISDRTCAIMLELVQGEGGVYSVDAPYLQALRKACDVYGILLIFDEIQTGLGRTGKMFASEHYGVKPDVMTLAKGIGGGFPLSAMLTTNEYDLFEPGDQGGTYTGNPLAMAAGMAVVQEILRLDLPTNAMLMGQTIKEQLASLAEKYAISAIRGKGLLLGFSVPEGTAAALAADCMEQGLIINAPNASTIRLMPSLTVTETEIDEMLLMLERSLIKLELYAAQKETAAVRA
ncbi:acetylornithine/N-succinyldiaminopimelate aminotransferase [Paenibacillus algorifonticola]|uniref:Acetylornithine/N-succinyldiaminopimelate aminotransferase n=1 Tax=Paenibacillus algorifonticola TaxID=684063 RepID=A0A1I2G3J5_9BACL|nr:acetylornithine/succinylornithine family transaminase [Paenibacillus algorifonticola]SFF11201.1 acetylornithine/N-succinyldiaminopimelate aminotransferase [Paenibacillus algorifonticola]